MADGAMRALHNMGASGRAPPRQCVKRGALNRKARVEINVGSDDGRPMEAPI